MRQVLMTDWLVDDPEKDGTEMNPEIENRDRQLLETAKLVAEPLLFIFGAQRPISIPNTHFFERGQGRE